MHDTWFDGGVFRKRQPFCLGEFHVFDSGPSFSNRNRGDGAVQYDNKVGWRADSPAEPVNQVPQAVYSETCPALLKCISPLSYCNGRLPLWYKRQRFIDHLRHFPLFGI